MRPALLTVDMEAETLLLPISWRPRAISHLNHQSSHTIKC
jgi:hypothetical protein